MAGEITEDRELPNLLGRRIGSYCITRELGRGGMGVVYLGIHEEIGQRAAIKVLLPTWSSDVRYAQRFINEARAASKVHHPGLIKLFDFGRMLDGSPYILMEYLDGELLRSRLTRIKESNQAALAPADALCIVRQLALAMQALHDEGIVHREV